MGSSGGGGGAGTSRYAGYIEGKHSTLLSLSEVALRDALEGTTNANSPYASITVIDPDESLLGVGNTITDYPSLYETFETYITDVDVDALYESILDSMINSTTIDAAITAEGVYLSDDIDQVGMPKINAGMRDINAVMSTGFIHNKAFMESQRVKTLSKFSTVLKTKAMNDTLIRWGDTLKWNISSVETYMKLNQYYWASRYDYIETKADMEQRDYTWPFTLMDFQRSTIGALQGAASSPGALPPTKGAKTISGGLGGAATGAMIGANYGKSGGYWGAGIGAIVGGIAGYYT